jgi:nucleoside-diphosphate-sugar epimerase
VYGDSMFDDIANRCIKSIKDSSPLLVYSGGTLTRDFLYIDDLAKILSQLIQSEFTLGLEYLNVSSGKGISISELIEQISQILSKKIKQLDVSRPSDVVKKSVLDNSKLREKVSCRYHTLEEGLTKYISS